MAAREVTFHQEEGAIVSEAIVAEGSEVAVRIEYEAPGLTSIERSITGDSFIYVATVMNNLDKRQRIEFNVSGVVPGQQLRLRFKDDAKPAKIYTL